MSNNTELKIIDNSNEWIDWIKESIVKKQIKFYDYNIQEIGFENIGKIYLKKIINGIKLQREADFHENIIRFYEIQNDNSKKYLLVMEYADSGTLRNYLSERFENLTWNDKLNLAFQLTDALSYLHDKEIVHHDLVVYKNTIKLTDFGLSKRIKELFNFQSNLLEMITHVDPRIFNRKSDSNNKIKLSLNKKSNIYSIGIILWEISSGQPPFYNELHDVGLAMKISQGLREKPVPNIFEDYIKIYTDCWNNEPDDRPTINQVVTKLNAIISDFKQNDSNANIQLSSEKLLKSNIEVPEKIIDNSLHEKMSQVIQTFSRINIKEIEPSILTNLIINDFETMVIEIIFFLENIETERRKHEIIDYLNNYNITLQEIYYWLSINQNDSNSIFLLGLFNHFGIEISVNKQKAFELLYQNAANSGNVSGIISLGYCHEKGIGTNVNRQKAFELYQKAANLGNSRGIYNLGVCYNNGIGTSIDNQKAFELYQKAANLGNLLGINNLGHFYLNGLGTNVNKQKAFELFQVAANLGDCIAQSNLGFMYENGEGIEKDINQAIYWYQKSADQGDQIAQEKYDELISEEY
ncbi:Ste20p [Rhizophagus irregularis DAOM 197198w]|uniref:Ste20p n=1 Tax=Rhizophagus irregularis (strain DAOM 197198w) TaxID=1432141 RepID=A0A015KG14_RHIIW|nr:Ste20p [Rhizophagus irregularis DAOM 197198w]